MLIEKGRANVNCTRVKTMNGNVLNWLFNGFTDLILWVTSHCAWLIAGIYINLSLQNCVGTLFCGYIVVVKWLHIVVIVQWQLVWTSEEREAKLRNSNWGIRARQCLMENLNHSCHWCSLALFPGPHPAFCHLQLMSRGAQNSRKVNVPARQLTSPSS